MKNQLAADAEARHRTMRPMLRANFLDYSRGWFFITIQAAFNKTIFGAIVGARALLKIEPIVGLPKNRLGEVVGRFKSYCSKLYRDLKAEGLAIDVGATPWQRDYYDTIVAEEAIRERVRAYIRNNPRKWTRDRFGLVTSHTYGNLALINSEFVGFVASQSAFQADLKPKLLWKRESSGNRHLDGGEAVEVLNEAKPPVISTFTSAQERAIFARILRNNQRFIRVYPGGIPDLSELDTEIRARCDEGRALLISPVESGTGLNKQRAVWCNEYILRNSAEVWAGELTPGHTLASLVAALAPKR